ncbi:MAG TPA: CYCXC family (seleno)protein [Pyrinomonadaceae bacterium]|nr:CYCXC family (seleno)protein [Pyrinomonadaceae bacterium]
MKKNWLLLGGIALLLVAAVLMVNSSRSEQPQPHDSNHSTTAPAHHPPADSAAEAQVIPAHFETPPSRASLGPTLSPEKFVGPTREAYRAAQEIPVTLAQLPCYCHCDRGFGHKSLYSCFQDEHASHCAVCVNEALLALKLEKEQKLTPAQIRETIIAQYSH